MLNHLLTIGSSTVDLLDPKLDSEPLGASYVGLLKEFVADTYERCSFHQRRMKSVGVKPDVVTSLEAFQQLPLLGSAEVSSISPSNLLPDNLRQAMAKGGFGDLPPGDRLAKVFQTSASTGYPKVSYYTQVDWEANCAMAWRHQRHIPREKISRILNCFHAGHYGGKNIEDAFNRCGNIVVPRHFTFLTAEEVIGQLGSALEDLGGINALAVPLWKPEGKTKGTALDELLDADLNNYIGKKVKTILTGGVPSDLAERQIKQKVWEVNDLAKQPHCTFLERYGGSEVGVAAAECEKNQLHLYQGVIYAEVVNEKTGRQVANGERGLVTFTGLRGGSRFVRYLVGDEATFLSDKCECGRVSPRVRQIRRVVDVERLKGGCAAGGY